MVDASLMHQYPELQNAPVILSDGNQMTTRVQEIKSSLREHFERIIKLDRYSRRQKTEWFSNKGFNAPSIMRSTIRASEKTAIAYLAGGTFTVRVASYGAYAGMSQQDEARSERDSRFERIARAIFHHIDRQSEVNLLYEPVRRAVRQGEIIMQFGWLPEEARRIDPPMLPTMAPQMTSFDDALGAEMGEGGGAPPPLPDMAPPAGMQTPMEGNTGGRDLASMLGQGNIDTEVEESKYRFPLAVRVLNRLKVFYELDAFGEPIEVYHSYTARASTLSSEYPEWAKKSNRNPHDPVVVIEGWVGAWAAVTIDGELVDGYPRLHQYGARPPFIIERCAPEEVVGVDQGTVMADIVVGMPFCADMIEAYEEACVGSSLKRVILENTAIGAYVLTKTNAARAGAPGTNEENAGITLGPGTIFQAYGEEELKPLLPPPLPPALAAYLEEAESDMASLSFSPAFLKGDSEGDPSGYAVEQIRQATMARLMPYRDGIDRAFSRLFEKLFEVLSTHWAPEWGSELTVFGQKEGEFFSETITEEDMSPPPQHVEVTLTPALPQNKIAERQANIAAWQAGTRDILTIMEEDGIAEPQEEYNSVLLHKQQLEDPMARAAAVTAIIQQRMARKGLNPQALMPAQAPQGQPPAGPPGAAQSGPQMPPGPSGGGPQPGPGGPTPNARPQGPAPQMPPGPRNSQHGPAPQQRPGMSPLGVPGAPNPPVQVQTKKRSPGGGH